MLFIFKLIKNPIFNKNNINKELNFKIKNCIHFYWLLNLFITEKNIMLYNINLSFYAIPQLLLL